MKSMDEIYALFLTHEIYVRGSIFDLSSAYGFWRFRRPETHEIYGIDFIIDFMP